MVFHWQYARCGNEWHRTTSSVSSSRQADRQTRRLQAEDHPAAGTLRLSLASTLHSDDWQSPLTSFSHGPVEQPSVLRQNKFNIISANNYHRSTTSCLRSLLQVILPVHPWTTYSNCSGKRTSRDNWHRFLPCNPKLAPYQAMALWPSDCPSVTSREFYQNGSMDRACLAQRLQHIIHHVGR